MRFRSESCSAAPTTHLAGVGGLRFREKQGPAYRKLSTGFPGISRRVQALPTGYPQVFHRAMHGKACPPNSVPIDRGPATDTATDSEASSFLAFFPQVPEELTT